MMDNKSRIISILVVLFLLTTLFVSHSTALKVDITKDNGASDYDGYIIKFTDEPLSMYRNRFSHFGGIVLNRFIDQKVATYNDKLCSLHNTAKEDITKILGEKAEKIFLKDFRLVFNGIIIKKVSHVFLEKIRNLPYVESVTPNYKITACLDESVSIVNADDVWELTDDYGQNVTGKGITIAIIDTGVDYTHPDLKDGFLGGYDFVNNDADPMDDNGHGTHCAGIAVGLGNASNSTYVGVAPGAKFYAYKILDDKGEGDYSLFLQGINQALDPNNDSDCSDHVDIISISSGALGGDPNDIICEVADNAVSLGAVVVAAAGNSGPAYSTINSPGCAREAICVGAADKDGGIYSRSSRGPTSIGTLKPDVMAPGVDIISVRASGTSLGTPISEYYTKASGTSMAAPHVSGAVALVLQAHPDWTPRQIKMALRNTAVDLNYNLQTQGYGRIDVLGAVLISDAPPIAILNTSGQIETEVLDIFGTASSSNFGNYSLYYKSSGGWTKIFEASEQMNDSLLFSWNVSAISNGTYQLKLDVSSSTQTSSDIVFISIGSPSEELLSIYEGQTFRINISDAGKPMNAFVLFRVPYHFPQIRYGSSVELKAPWIINPFFPMLHGEITIFKLLGGYKKLTINITIVNKELF